MKAGTGEITTNEIYNSDSSDEDDDEHFKFSQKSKNKEKNQISDDKNSGIDNYDDNKIGKLNNNIKYSIFILASLCTCLDGFILIFLGYNSSILTKEWNWGDNSIALLEITYHLVSALGGVLSIFTTRISTKNGLNYGVALSILAFFISIPLLNIQLFPLYAIIFFVICLSNGHLQNISTTLIVKKFHHEIRASIYVFAYFFTQFGKFLFACLIYKFNNQIIKGDLTMTVIPILTIIILQIVINIILIDFKKKKSNLKIEKSKQDDENRHFTLGGIIEIDIPNNLTSNQLPGDNFLQRMNFISIFSDPLYELFTSYKYHIFNLIFLNLSLGIQFFSMINVFPLLKNQTNAILVDEIFISKAYHTLFLLFLPFIFLFSSMTRKFLLTITFSSSLILNICIISNIFSSGLMIHYFRFIWNVCFITINLYCAESVANKLRGVNTAIMYLIFKISCVIEILTIDKLISVSIYLPVALNILILIGDLLLTNKLKIETHMKCVEEIEKETNSLYVQ